MHPVGLTSHLAWHRRELALLLLEDPLHRLRMTLCDEILRYRLPEVYASSPQYAVGNPSRVKQAITHDPLSQNIFRVELAGLGIASSGVDGDWGQAVLWLDAVELARCCSLGKDLGASLEPALTPTPGIIAAAAALRTSASPSSDSASDHLSTALYSSAGNGCSSMEHALLLAVGATWPQHDTDDDDYLATALGFVLVGC